MTSRLTTLLLLILPTLTLAAPGTAGCGTGSWIAGTTEICDGTLVYRDYIFDDYGATIGNPNAASTPGFSPPAGKVRYQTDVNSADLVALRLRVVGSELHVSFEMNSLFNPDSTFAALAIDTDNNQATGGGAWADLLAVEQPHGSGTGQPLRSSGWEQVHVFEQGDPDTNLIEGSIPLPAGSTWRIQAVTGIKSRRIVMNAAFRNDNGNTIGMFGTTSHFFDANQAATLSTTDISAFGVEVDVSKLVSGVTEPAPQATGFHQRVYESEYTISQDPDTGEIYYDGDAEGMTYAGIVIEPGSFPVEYNFLGKYQPYGIYIPAQDGPHGMQMTLHGANQSHEALVSQPGMQQNTGEAYNNIVATPLGRGPNGWYYGISEKDVLDVMSDIEANYPVDPERVYVSGYSMGGYGAFRFAAMYPDRFAGYMIWTGATARGGLDTLQVLQNTRQVPGAMLYNGGDELVRVDTFYLPLEAKFLELGYESILYFHPAGDHFSLNIEDDWRKEAAWTLVRERQTQPAQVTFRTLPFTWNPDIGVIHDRAYWVQDIVGHDTGAGDFVDVDLVTYGCGGSLPVTEKLFPNGAGPDPLPWSSQEFDVIDETPLPQQNRVEGSVSNVASLTINVNPDDGACMTRGPIDYQITTDAAGTINFSDGRSIELPGPGTYTGQTVERPNIDPVANDDTAETDAGGEIDINVLANDTDADGDNLVVTAASNPANGSVVVNDDDTITYTPAAGFFGTDSFTYTISDNRGGADSAEVTVTVNDVGNNAPSAKDDEADTTMAEPVTIDVVTNDEDEDGDALSVIAVTEPANGSVVISSASSVTYTPAAGFTGTDSFDYTVSDGRGGEDEATVIVTVAAENGTSEGRVHGSGHLERGTGEKYDKIDFSFDAKFDKKKGLKGKLKVHDKALDLKIDAKTITSLSTGQGEWCDGVLMDGINSFAFEAVGELEAGEDKSEGLSFRACGADHGKHGSGKDGQPADRFHVEVLGGGYRTGARTPDSNIDGGNVHLHDPITPAGDNSMAPGEASPASPESGAEEQPSDENDVTVLDLDPILVSEAPAGTPLALVAIAHTPSGAALSEIPLVLVWETDTATGEVQSLTNGTGVAVFQTLVPEGDVSYFTRSGELESNAVRITGF